MLFIVFRWISLSTSVYFLLLLSCHSGSEGSYSCFFVAFLRSFNLFLGRVEYEIIFQFVDLPFVKLYLVSIH